jgi:hypothetical protein
MSNEDAEKTVFEILQELLEVWDKCPHEKLENCPEFLLYRAYYEIMSDEQWGEWLDYERRL